MGIDVSNMEVELRKLRIRVKCTVNGRGHMRLELRQRKKEQGWWESGWIREQDRWKELENLLYNLVTQAKKS